MQRSNSGAPVLGAPIMDQHHRELYEAFHQIADHPDPNRFQERFSDFLDRMREHFVQEEQLMGRMKYAQTDIHVAHHQMILDDMEALLARFVAADKQGREEIVLSLRGESIFFEHWLTRHVDNDDRSLILALRVQLGSTIAPSPN